MTALLKHSIPSSLRVFLRKQYFHLHKNELNDLLKKHLHELSHSRYEPILFAGYIKSGNTWLRFLIHNYFNILVNGASSTLTYEDLNQVQHDELGSSISLRGPAQGFPYLVRTHRHYSSAFRQFNKCIYIYRHPLDTLVSAYYFHKNNEDTANNLKAAKYLNNIDEYVLYHLPLWELHLESYLRKKSAFSTTYEKLKANPVSELKRALQYLGYSPHPKTVELSVTLSSFENIQKMGRQRNQRYGNGGESFKGEFTRKGIVGGYRDNLKEETIEKAKKIIQRQGLI